jgi:hypothetical protein
MPLGLFPFVDEGTVSPYAGCFGKLFAFMNLVSSSNNEYNLTKFDTNCLEMGAGIAQLV